ncbi:MAG: hypothetical protein AB7O55_19850 [Lautropia sp.]
MIGSFETLEPVERLRRELLAAGVPDDRVELRVLADEAGGSAGNFAVGNGDTSSGSLLSVAGVASYPKNFAEVRTPGHCLLVVCPASEEQRGRVIDLMGQAYVPEPTVSRDEARQRPVQGARRRVHSLLRALLRH